MTMHRGGIRLPEGTTLTVHPSLLRSNLRDWDAVERTVSRNGNRCVAKNAQGEVTAEFTYDRDGFLESWKAPEAEEFTRVTRRRRHHWQPTDSGDERILEGR